MLKFSSFVHFFLFHCSFVLLFCFNNNNKKNSNNAKHRKKKLWQIVHASEMYVCLLFSFVYFYSRKHKSSGKFGEKLIIDWFKTCYVVLWMRRIESQNSEKEPRKPRARNLSIENLHNDRITIVQQHTNTNMRIRQARERREDRVRMAENATIVTVAAQPTNNNQFARQI